MDINTALDHVRSYVTRWAKPLEQIEEVLEAALIAEAQLQRDQKALGLVKSEITAAQQQIVQLREVEAVLAPRVREAKEQTEATVAWLSAERDKAAAEYAAYLTELSDKAAAAKTVLETEAQARQERLMADLAEVQRKLAHARAEYDAFMKKVGAA